MNSNSLIDEIRNRIIKSFCKYSFERYIRRRRETEYKFLKEFSKVYGDRVEIYSVSEIIKCKMQAMIERELLQSPEDFERWCFRPSMMIGDAIEERLIDLLNLPRGYFNFKIIDFYGKKIIITGSCDAIDDDYIYEFKFRSKDAEPTPLMVMQTRLYAWLYNKKHGILIIISPYDIKKIELDPFNEREVIDILLTWTSPRYLFECYYCPYRDICEKRKKEQII